MVMLFNNVRGKEASSDAIRQDGLSRSGVLRREPRYREYSWCEATQEGDLSRGHFSTESWHIFYHKRHFLVSSGRPGRNSALPGEERRCVRVEMPPASASFPQCEVFCFWPGLSSPHIKNAPDEENVGATEKSEVPLMPCRDASAFHLADRRLHGLAKHPSHTLPPPWRRRLLKAGRRSHYILARD